MTTIIFYKDFKEITPNGFKLMRCNIITIFFMINFSLILRIVFYVIFDIYILINVDGIFNIVICSLTETMLILIILYYMKREFSNYTILLFAMGYTISIQDVISNSEYSDYN